MFSRMKDAIVRRVPNQQRRPGSFPSNTTSQNSDTGTSRDAPMRMKIGEVSVIPATMMVDVATDNNAVDMIAAREVPVVKTWIVSAKAVSEKTKVPTRIGRRHTILNRPLYPTKDCTDTWSAFGSKTAISTS